MYIVAAEDVKKKDQRNNEAEYYVYRGGGEANIFFISINRMNALEKKKTLIPV